MQRAVQHGERRLRGRDPRLSAGRSRSRSEADGPGLSPLRARDGSGLTKLCDSDTDVGPYEGCAHGANRRREAESRRGDRRFRRALRGNRRAAAGGSSHRRPDRPALLLRWPAVASTGCSPGPALVQRGVTPCEFSSCPVASRLRAPWRASWPGCHWRSAVAPRRRRWRPSRRLPHRQSPGTTCNARPRSRQDRCSRSRSAQRRRSATRSIRTRGRRETRSSARTAQRAPALRDAPRTSEISA